MATIHISGADAARDFTSLMAKVREGAEVIIEDGTYPPAVLCSAVPAPRTISESIEIARRLQEETSEAPVLDADFADDVAEIIRNRKPWTPPAWD
jgi:antitoxin (DNA-binding transcriptional repressor) of toxin-antitoxin stability system